MARPADPHARAALIAAARAEFLKKGIRGARIEDITAACGLSKGAFYLHYSSKEALFSEVVGEFAAAMQQLIDQRIGETDRFFAEHGPVEAHDVAERSERYERMVAMNTEADLGTLELMWAYRDVVHVLMRGSQGTDFESLMWGMVDREVTRVTQEFHRLQLTLACRPDVPATVIGSLIVGTYLLLAQQMSQMERKPDLKSWAGSIHRLIREGSLPPGFHASRAPEPKTKLKPKTSPRRPQARALSRTRSTPRS
ncbi:TetR/AcrR family transcriptional regulator [Vitiosangium sp. GDMCC 1.1324]|uniref:TetR/AcrR family transcriptional regulator n=1 Tax=Vitiosangium sp. (strain GDMCC 1.1324) TaxID=2138576 RepID=UPI000D384C44|nr:TetR/AcrR family transcriptional regulator [Vitiosangium sp. GDMCC 1.1324]PTL80016.1 TetR/AcrR family transcriptional regulator [Vitiosangium sp. GDMCC 1.1324]